MSKQSRGGVSQSPDSPISEVGLHDYRDMESDMEIPDPRGCHSPQGSISESEVADSGTASCQIIYLHLFLLYQHIDICIYMSSYMC